MPMGSWSSSSGRTPTPSRDKGPSASWSPRICTVLGARRLGGGRGGAGSGTRRERCGDEGARFLGVDAVGLHAGCDVVEDAVGIAPEPVLLELILELDAETPGEYREVVLDRDAAFGLEAADHPLTAMVDAGERVGARVPRAFDLVAHERVPYRLTEGKGNGGRARAAEARLGLERYDAHARHGSEQLAAGLRLALAGL